MQYKVITFASRADHYNVGQGGYSCAHGIHIVNNGTEIALEGINSRGKVGATTIVVPKTSIDEVIATLTAMRSAPVPTKEIVPGKFTVQIDGEFTAAYDTAEDVDCDPAVAVARAKGMQVTVYWPEEKLA